MGQEGNLSTDKFDPTTFKFRVLVYGAPGTWKTRFLNTAPKPYVFDTDKGLLSVLGADIGYYQPETYQELISKLAVITAEVSKGTWDRQTLALDSASTAYDLIIQDALRYAWVGGSQGQGKRFEVTNSLREIREESDYGLSHNRLIQIIMTMKRLPLHLIVTCHEQIDKIDVFGAKKEVGTLELPGKMPYKLPALFDTVFRTKVFTTQDEKTGQSKIRVMLQTATDGNYLAKHRAPPGRELPLYVEPDFTAILNHLLGIAPKEGA